MRRYISGIKKLHLNGREVLHDRTLSDTPITTLERIGGELVHTRCKGLLSFKGNRLTPEGNEAVWRCNSCHEDVYVPDIIWSRIPLPKDAFWS